MPTYRTGNNQFCIQQTAYDSGPALNAAGFIGGEYFGVEERTTPAILDDARHLWPDPRRPIAPPQAIPPLVVLANQGLAQSFGFEVTLDEERFIDSFGGGIATQYAIALEDLSGFVCAAMDLEQNELNPCLYLMPATLTVEQAEGLMRGALMEGFIRWPALRDGTVIGQCDARDVTGVAALNFYAARYPQIAQTTADGVVTNRWTARQAADAFSIPVP